MRIKVNKEEKKSPVINRHLETWKTTVNKRVIGINCCYHDDYKQVTIQNIQLNLNNCYLQLVASYSVSQSVSQLTNQPVSQLQILHVAISYRERKKKKKTNIIKLLTIIHVLCF